MGWCMKSILRKSLNPDHPNVVSLGMLDGTRIFGGNYKNTKIGGFNGSSFAQITESSLTQASDIVLHTRPSNIESTQKNAG